MERKSRKRITAKKSVDSCRRACYSRKDLDITFAAIGLPIRPPYPSAEAKSSYRTRKAIEGRQPRPEKKPDDCTFDQLESRSSRLNKAS
jgi:hypothetical protein